MLQRWLVKGPAFGARRSHIRPVTQVPVAHRGRTDPCHSPRESKRQSQAHEHTGYAIQPLRLVQTSVPITERGYRHMPRGYEHRIKLFLICKKVLHLNSVWHEPCQIRRLEIEAPRSTKLTARGFMIHVTSKARQRFCV